MSIDMYLGSSQSQATSISSMISSQNTGYEQLQAALCKFSFQEGLKGKAYDSAKAYSNTILIPLVKACILLNDAINDSGKKLPAKYTAEVDSVDLKESELREKIMQTDRIIGRYQDLSYSMRCREKPNWQTINNLDYSISIQQGVKQTLEEKLTKLLNFNASSPAIFDQISTLQAAVTTGLGQANASWNASTQLFELPSKKEMEWTKTVDEEWEKKLKSQSQLLKNDLKDYVIAVSGGNEESVQEILDEIEEEFSFELIETFLKKGSEEFLKRLPKFAAYMQRMGLISTLYTMMKTYGLTGSAKVAGKFSEAVSYVSSGAVSASNGIGSAFGNLLNYGSKAISVLAAGKDFYDQIIEGENFIDATVKTVGHFAIGISVGSLIASIASGALSGATIGSGIPVLGTFAGFFAGALAGAVATVAFSIKFDEMYDASVGKVVDFVVNNSFLKDINKEITKTVKEVGDAVVSKVEDTISDVGDAVSGFFSDIGSAFSF
ncbi:hypothetical protein [Streptococcus sp. CSL10205-OR2]|uniref:hypothetical protein n=1 Tax=Streptococcus sp. CSL10205-OR2 TaxID=2980558 RepID=UPI0021DA117D|nr:hypothetical protein [Streptococcus sp. CSL10205-OR2]MCU9533516.1 hypothetical protein [Streptococcus sp. CSL10205-OR2]